MVETNNISFSNNNNIIKDNITLLSSFTSLGELHASVTTCNISPQHRSINLNWWVEFNIDDINVTAEVIT